jgi:hypothetical protein
MFISSKTKNTGASIYHFSIEVAKDVLTTKSADFMVVMPSG